MVTSNLWEIEKQLLPYLLAGRKNGSTVKWCKKEISVFIENILNWIERWYTFFALTCKQFFEENWKAVVCIAEMNFVVLISALHLNTW